MKLSLQWFCKQHSRQSQETPLQHFWWYDLLHIAEKWRQLWTIAMAYHRQSSLQFAFHCITCETSLRTMLELADQQILLDYCCRGLYVAGMGWCHSTSSNWPQTSMIIGHALKELRQSISTLSMLTKVHEHAYQLISYPEIPRTN